MSIKKYNSSTLDESGILILPLPPHSVACIGWGRGCPALLAKAQDRLWALTTSGHQGAMEGSVQWLVPGLQAVLVLQAPGTVLVQAVLETALHYNKPIFLAKKQV